MDGSQQEALFHIDPTHVPRGAALENLECNVALATSLALESNNVALAVALGEFETTVTLIDDATHEDILASGDSTSSVVLDTVEAEIVVSNT